MYNFTRTVADPSYHDTSGSAPNFLLASGGNDNLVKLWDIFTASGIQLDLVFSCITVMSMSSSRWYLKLFDKFEDTLLLVDSSTVKDCIMQVAWLEVNRQELSRLCSNERPVLWTCEIQGAQHRISMKKTKIF